MQARLLLGPAGSGKTLRCLAELQEALVRSAEGPPLLLVAPKQTTYQLERQLLVEPSLSGYARAQVLSFERLAFFILDQLRKPAPKMLDEEGRVMVLRSLLARKRDDLKLFRASARLTGFAQQLSRVLSELQRHRLTPDSLNELSAQVQGLEGLAYKLQDLALLLRDYLAWLKAHNLQDTDCLLDAATLALAENPAPSPPFIESLWLDGFAELTPQELELLAALVPRCGKATVTFCLERPPTKHCSWLSVWSVVQTTFEKCKQRLGGLPNAAVSVERLQRAPHRSRFLDNAVLRELEELWADPQPSALDPRPSLGVAVCANPDGEATLAAREILGYVRGGGRYREITVLVRNLAGYHQPLQRVLSRYEIPFFLDRRESVSHHPLAELTRSALRTVAFQWQRDDWFAALKTGLAPAEDVEIDRLENEALARGWKGSVWQQPIVIADDPDLTRWLARLLPRILPPFQKLALALAAPQSRPTGPQLAAALREFWTNLRVEEQLEDWAAADPSVASGPISNSVHATVWGQMNAWLENLELAFAVEALSLRQWLPILEAGLAGLTVGVIPPALDQVLVGAIDRSRNPDVMLALVLGMNEGIFPAQPERSVLLTETDREEIARHNVSLSATTRNQLSRERYLAYLACTRARRRLVLAYALQDVNGAPLNPSPFLAHVKKIFPSLEFETIPRQPNWRESEHANELIRPLLRVQSPESKGQSPGWEELARLPAVAGVMEGLSRFQSPMMKDGLAPALAAQLYGSVLRTSVSRVEQFAACPFRFFIHSGLRAEDRKRFELDVKEQGNFQHDVLALFHEQLRREKKRWRDLAPAEARERIARIASEQITRYRDGLLQTSDQTRFAGRVLTESLQDFVETLVGWISSQQYQFDPVAVELPFGPEENSPAWQLALGNGHRLALHGRIDRVDLWRNTDAEEALCVVVDYKSSQKRLDPALMKHGIQLQLLAYLAVLRHWPDPRRLFGVARLHPVGVFYVNLRGKYGANPNRRAALESAAQARKLAYQHTGRFDSSALPYLDSRRDATEGDQFNYRRTQKSRISKQCHDPLPADEFQALLDSVESNLRKMGHAIFSGVAKVDPYQKGSTAACDQCDYRAICRIDPWTHSFRVLRNERRSPNG